MLLLFIEILDLVQIQEDPLRGQQGPHLGDHILHIRQRRIGGIEPMEGPVGPSGNDIGHRGLSGAGGTIENQIGDGPSLNDAAQESAFAQNMLLAHHLIQILGPYLICQGPVFHCTPSFSQRFML